MSKYLIAYLNNSGRECKCICTGSTAFEAITLWEKSSIGKNYHLIKINIWNG